VTEIRKFIPRQTPVYEGFRLPGLTKDITTDVVLRVTLDELLGEGNWRWDEVPRGEGTTKDPEVCVVVDRTFGATLAFSGDYLLRNGALVSVLPVMAFRSLSLVEIGS